MDRRVNTVTIAIEGRDKNKQFKITEMSADKGERWFIRLLLALAKAGAKVPEGGVEAFAASYPALLVQGIQSLQGMDFPDVEPLLNEMLTCVQYVPPQAGIPAQQIFEGDACQISEVKTFIFLRGAVLEAHLGFSLADALKTLTRSQPAASA